MSTSVFYLNKILIKSLFYLNKISAIIKMFTKEPVPKKQKGPKRTDPNGPKGGKKMQNILIVDDDKEIVKAIEIYLERKKYQIFKAFDGIEALEQIKQNDINLIILDIMMPNKDGIETLTEIRKDKNIPVILLSAKSEDIDKIHGLNLGADDYITKPFNPAELIARVNALLRRYTNFETEETNNKNIIKNGGLIINDDLKKVTIDGKEIKLTPTEYNILKFLTENKGKVYSIEDIYQKVWKDDYFASDNVIAVHIRHIREKIEINPKEPRYLKVIWGVGYKVECL